METTVSMRYPLPALLLTVAAWMWFLFALVFLYPGCPLIPFLAMAFSGLVLAVAWLFGAAVLPQLFRRGTRIPWMSVPLAGFLGCVLLISVRGQALRVALSEPALSAHVESALASEKPEEFAGRVGLFQVEEIRISGGGVYFYTGNAWIDRVGIAYLPPGTVPAPRMRVRHLYGPWYQFCGTFRHQNQGGM